MAAWRNPSLTNTRCGMEIHTYALQEKSGEVAAGMGVAKPEKEMP
jgi:hypothetical protein